MSDNGSAFAGQLFVGLLAFLIFRFLQSVNALPVLTWTFGGLALLMAIAALVSTIQFWRWSKLLAKMAEAPGILGRVTFPISEEAEEIGLSFSNDDGNGLPVGAVGKRLLYARTPAPVSIRAPTNAGKTGSSSAPICFALGAHRNIIATSKGIELAYLTGPYRREILKQQVIYVDEWKLMKRHGLPSHSFNPIGHLPRYAGSPELIDKARAMALILVPEAENASGENKVFRNNARSLLTWTAVYLALHENDTGELTSNLPNLAKTLGGSTTSLRRFFEEMQRCELYDGSVRRAAERVLSQMENAPKFAESVMVEVRGALDIYDPAGPLAGTDWSDFDPRDLKNPKTPTTIYLIFPPEKAALYGAHIGLCMNTLVDLCIEVDRFEPRVTIVGDEWASLGVLPSALPMLYLGRSRGVQLISYVQSTESYARYGKESEAFTTQSELVVAWSVRSTKDAKEYSERSGTRSVVLESVTAPDSSRHSIGLSEKAIPYRRPDEFLQMKDFTATVFYKQNPPLTVDLAPFWAVDKWQAYAKPVPGSPPIAATNIKYRA